MADIKSKIEYIVYSIIYFILFQGAFFLVFYFLLNDEVQTVYKKKRKKKTLNKQSYHSSDDGNSQSENMIHQVKTNVYVVSDLYSTLLGELMIKVTIQKYILSILGFEIIMKLLNY